MNETQIEYCYECAENRGRELSKRWEAHKKGHRVCNYCELEKIYTDYPKNKNKKHGIDHMCKQCYRELHLKRKYGITINEYNRMLNSQNNKCAVCNSTSKGKKNAKYFSVDHCHTTGKVRGLLCNHCNAGIGNMKDDVVILEKAIAYLREMNK